MAEPPRTLRELLEVLAPELVDGRTRTWRDKAACVGSGVDHFSDRESEIAAARAICRRCAEQQCAHVGATETQGVWGGLALAERGKAGGGRAETGRRGLEDNEPQSEDKRDREGSRAPMPNESPYECPHGDGAQDVRGVVHDMVQ